MIKGEDVGNRLRHLGRILASGVLFLLLGLGGIFFTTLFLPVMRLLPGGPEGRQRRARALIHHLFRSFVFALEASGILRLDVRGLPDPEALKGRLILANHPGYLDVVVLISLIGQAVCVVKESVWNNWFFGRLIREAGYVRNLDPSDCLRDAGAALGRGDPMILFPEGTRSDPGAPLAFRRGAAHLALLSGAEILALGVSCSPALLDKGSRWYDMPVRTCHYRVVVLPPVPVAMAALAGRPSPLAARQFSKILEDHFNRGPSDPDPAGTDSAVERPS